MLVHESMRDDADSEHERRWFMTAREFLVHESKKDGGA